MNYNNQPRQGSSWTQGYNVFVDGKLDITWVADKAQQFAIFLDKTTLSGTQLRAFYNEFIRIRDIQSSPIEKQILIKLLAAKISYRHTAKSTDIPQELLRLIESIVEQIDGDVERFKQACYVMEAIVGFFPKK